MTQTPRSIEEILLETDLPDRAVRKGVRRALLRHKLLGQPIAVSRKGEVVWIPADEIEVPPDEDAEEWGGGSMLPFERFVGIDYSGAGAPDRTTDGLAVVASEGARGPERVEDPAPGRRLWSRRDLAEWLVDTLSENHRTLVGIDHAFSPPLGESWADRTWDAVLRDCTDRWRTHECSVANAEQAWRVDLERAGQPAYRLTEEWTSSAKSVWDKRRNGVLHSTVAGIPWLFEIRKRLGSRAHFWPFDGWSPAPSRHVIVEVYPALFWRRYERERDFEKNSHFRDAYAVCRWFQDMSDRGALDGYFSPPLTLKEKQRARVEGWIFGVA